MRCSKAREYYFKNRDDLLNEAERMKLQEHLAECSACLRFEKEMNAGLGLLDQLSEPEAPDNFEWNVRRKIARRKADIMRKQSRFNENSRWSLKFFAGAAAMIVIMLLGAWYFLGDWQEDLGASLHVSGANENYGIPSVSAEDNGSVGLSNTSYPEGFRMVSDDPYGSGLDNNYNGQMSPEILRQSRLRYLTKENLLLKSRVIKLKRENVMLRNLLEKYSKKNN
ncbi:MAG: zf-HC2 domain-containing protein [Candidatus Krumholzibacteriota bacterium]|nr:zf-HC2 domain-containing protein [Candidatus Krumholzibacteriota bacterium]